MCSDIMLIPIDAYRSVLCLEALKNRRQATEVLLDKPFEVQVFYYGLRVVFRSLAMESYLGTVWHSTHT